MSHTNCVLSGDAFRCMTDNISACPRNYEHADISLLVTVAKKIAIDLTCAGTEAFSMEGDSSRCSWTAIYVS